VVLQELAEAEDTPSDIIFDHLWSQAFAGQPLGRSILGSEDERAGDQAGRPVRLARPPLSRRLDGAERGRSGRA
jgi:hypothetical protein